MKRIILFWLLCYGWLIGCQTNKGLVSPAVSQLPSVALSPTALVLATAPSTSPVAASLPSPTSTSSPTPLPTLPPTPMATATPFVNGEIYFLWNPEKLPEELGLHFPLYHLYRAIPSHEKGQWEIETVLTDLEPGSVFLSPDQTHLAIINSDTKDAAYRYPTQIDIFSFQNNQVEFRISMNVQIDNGFSVDDLFWMPDGQTIIYAKNTSLFSVSLKSPTLSIPFAHTPPYPKKFYRIDEFVGSLEGNFLLLSVAGGETKGIYIFNLIDQTLSLVKTDVNVGQNLQLDLKEEWFVFTGNQNLGLWLVNLQSLECDQLVGEEHLSFPVWSPDGSWLTFNEGSNLYVWERQSQTVRLLATGGYFTQAAWSPDRQTLVVGVGREDGTHLMFIDKTAQIIKEINTGLNIPMVRSYGMLDPFVWSPSGDWVLFPADVTGVIGLQYYILDTENGQLFSFIDARETGIAYGFVWVAVKP